MTPQEVALAFLTLWSDGTAKALALRAQPSPVAELG